MEVLAEGIENEKQLEMLLTMGCLQGQGFFFSKPLSAHAMADFLLEKGSPQGLLASGTANL